MVLRMEKQAEYLIAVNNNQPTLLRDIKNLFEKVTKDNLSYASTQDNFNLMRKIALELLKKDTSIKAGIKGKRLKAGWDESSFSFLFLKT